MYDDFQILSDAEMADPIWSDLNPEIVRRFFAYFPTHPKMWKLIVDFAEKAYNEGRSHYGIHKIIEDIRHNTCLEYGEDDFKCPNDFRAGYARLLILRFPDKYKNFFRLRSSGGRTRQLRLCANCRPSSSRRADGVGGSQRQRKCIDNGDDDFQILTEAEMSDPIWLDQSPEVVRRFFAYFPTHPKTWKLIVEFAERAYNEGRTHYGMQKIAEDIRHNTCLEYGEDELKCNDTFNPGYARLLILRFPDKYKNFFRLKSGGRTRQLCASCRQIIRKEEEEE